MRTVTSDFRFSDIERVDLLKAWALTSLAFTVFFLRSDFLGTDGLAFFSFLVVFLIAAVTGGVGFIVHELAHKVAAHRFRVHGEFRSNDTMLLLSLVFAAVGFLFAAPGAVVLFGSVDRRESGIISAAGPVANMVLALLFLPVALWGGAFATVGQIGLFINAMLGAFNLIPIPGFDGEKVMRWNGWVYAGLLVCGGSILVAAYSL